ncbi:hypothetical protein GGR51DRAFT_534060 [Nemania sp. FL0031]|nr:hypothetical protein GGR51DRAFT_534060 [Nemania sp. FL0031]
MRPFGPQVGNSEGFKQTTQRLAMLGDFRSLQSIVANTIEFIRMGRSGAAWNEKIHVPMLGLAVIQKSNVTVENVSKASIIQKFLLSSTPARNAQLNKGTIGYVLALRPEPGFREALLHFISPLDHKTFNQTKYVLLRTWPAGIFIKINEPGQSVEVAKIQLGIWVASWFNRVATIPREFTPPNVLSRSTLPFVPVLLVDRGKWDMFFAFNDQQRYDIRGPVHIGDTWSLRNAYRLLAALRHIVQWMVTDFRAWVEVCLDESKALY